MTEIPNSVYFAVVRNLQRTVVRIQAAAILLADVVLFTGIALRILYGPSEMLPKYVLVWGAVFLFNAVALWLNPSSSWIARKAAVGELSKYSSNAHDQLLADVELYAADGSIHKEAHDLIRIAHKSMYAPADNPINVGTPTALRLIIVAVSGVLLTGALIAQTGITGFLLIALEEWTSTVAAAAIAISLFTTLRKPILWATRTNMGTVLFCAVMILITAGVCWLIVRPVGGFTPANTVLMLQNLLQALAFVAAVFVVYRFLAYGWRGLVPFSKPRQIR